MKLFEKVPRISRKEFEELLEKKESFVLYVRNQRLLDRVKEIFDLDVIFPEIAEKFPGVKFFWAEEEDLSLMGVFPPTVIIFREGKEVKKLTGVKSWGEYLRSVEEALG